MLVQCLPIASSPPSLADNTADLDRLRKTLAASLGKKTATVALHRLRPIARQFRQAGFQGAAVVNNLPNGPELVDFLPALPDVLPALALDLGTTHLEAELIDLLDGRILAAGTAPNRQAIFGNDILSRLHFAGKNDGLDRLHQVIIACINDLAADLCRQAGLSPTAIRAMCVAGNTAMSHFLLRLDPFHLCREPYIPLVNQPDPCHASDLGLLFHPDAVIWIMPGIGAYFGGDLISGILAAGLDRKKNITMLIDVGTNAEVVLGNREWLICCAGAAGPALEGGVARMGMQAGTGAIDRVEILQEGREIRYSTIGNSAPIGICGSGIIDLVAGLYLNRLIDARGKLTADTTHQRLTGTTAGPGFIVAAGEETASGQPIIITQVDLDALMRSKAAMYAILTTLVNQVGVSFAELQRIYVAGAFGRHIDPQQAITLGMIPDLPLATYIAAGNTSLQGTKLILTSRAARQRCRKVFTKITYLELNVNQEFMMRFSGCKFIPHTDRHLFPSVPFFT